MLFQDTAGGTGTGTPPVQTLYRDRAHRCHADVDGDDGDDALVDVHADRRQQDRRHPKTSGDVFTWNVTTKALSAAAVASGVAKLTLGGGAGGRRLPRR